MTLRNLLHQFRRIDSWLIAPALLIVIFGELTHLSAVGAIESYFWDKTLHFTAYFGLSLMTTIAVRANRNALWWALGLVLLGGSLAIIQGFKGRDADIFDELANTMGVLAGLGVGWLGISFLKTRNLVGAGGED